jgi:hypothetical protein
MFRSVDRARVLLALALAAVGACGGAEEPAAIDPGQTDPVGVGAQDGAGAPARAGQDAGASSPALASTSDAGTAKSDGGASGARDAGGQPGSDAGAAGCVTFNSSFEAIQKIIFEKRGCTAAACHGEAKVGGLDLRADVAWKNLVDARSANSKLSRVQPGTAVDSFLYLKLLAATEPGSVQIAGSPMPVGAAPLSKNELDAIRLWILKGAPETGTVSDPTMGIDVGSLLDACLPPVKPVKAKPLDPPAVDEGIQFIFPSYVLKAASEVEHCTPFAYDFTEKVPAQFKDVTRNVMFINGSRVRQDPQSHHLVLWNPAKELSSVADDDPDWTCRGGPNAGQHCNAQKGSADCGEAGVCAGKTTPGSICGIETLAFGSGTFDDIVAGLFGFGPKPLTFEELLGFAALMLGSGMPAQIANAQAPQQYLPPLDGIYTELPLRGILWFDSHAFNLTEEDTTLDARLNYYYATKREREMRGVTDYSANSIADGQAPFTRKTYCAKHEVPQNYSLAMMTGHTHRRGEHFWVTDAAGKKIYENFSYADPEYKRYEPMVLFDAPDAAARTLEFCATYSNGLKADNSPDLSLVTRASRMPDRSKKCTPVACVAGKVMAACSTDKDCDSAPGKGDGDCDACPITAGQTTENEMFVLEPWYVLPPKQ